MDKGRRLILTLLFLILVCSGVEAERIKRFLSRQGYTRNSVTSIVQGSDGFMWIGSPDGLFRYDGYNFEIMQHELGNENSLINNEVNSVHETPDGLLWIVTRIGLSIYDPELQRFHNQVGFPFNVISFVAPVGPKRYILGTHDGIYASKFIEGTDSLEIHELTIQGRGFAQGSDFNFIEKHDGKIYLGASSSLLEFDIDSLTLESFSNIQPKLYPDVSTATLSQSVSVPDYGLVISTIQGLFVKHDNERPKPLVFPEYPILNKIKVRSLHVDKSGFLWVGTFNIGLLRIDLKNKQLKVYQHEDNNNMTLGSNHVNALCEDHSGVLWIGTSRGGLNKLNLEHKPFTHIFHDPWNKESLASNLIDGIYEDQDGHVWIGTFDEGLNMIEFNEDGRKIHKLKDQLKADRVFSIVQDKDGRIYCGSDKDGLIAFEWDNGIKNLQKIPLTDESGNSYGNISKILIDQEGIFWMGMNMRREGLIRYNPKDADQNVKVFKGKTDFNLGTIDRIVDICEDHLGDLWVGTQNDGVFRVRLDQSRMPGRIKQYVYRPNWKNSITGNRAFAIHEGSDGNIWIGLFGGGLNKITPPDNKRKLSIQHFNHKVGLADDAVYGILEDDNENLWISTNNGISKFNISTQTFTNYDMEDGLQENNFRKYAFHRGGSGKFYFGGINGITVFDPNEIQDNSKEALTRITRLKIFNTELKVGETNKGLPEIDRDISKIDKLVLDYSNNTFTIDFVGLHYASPEKNKYKYKLEGYNEEWVFVESDRRFASFANLRPGDYKFLVTAANSDGTWSSNPATIELEILPPWWQTWWAYLMYGLIVFFGLLLFRNIIVFKQEYISRLNIERLEKEKIKELNQAKLRFFTNISHEFKTPLALILGPLGEICDDEERLSLRIRKNLGLIRTNADRMLRLIDQLVDFRKMESGHLSLKYNSIDIISYITHIAKSFREAASKKNITLSISSATDQLNLLLDQDKVEKILYNVLSNALKFTPEHGLITVSMRVKTRKVKELGDEIAYWSVQNNMEEFFEIRISDTGKGIPQNDLNNIFDRYYGKENVDKSDISDASSGIGLALVKGLVQLHQGELGVYSSEGNTCFIIRFPMNSAQAFDLQSQEIKVEVLPDIDEVAVEEQIVNVEDSEDKSKPLILVVDDHQEMREFVKQTLEKNYRVMIAENGKDAYDQVMQMIPDLIISDVMMPEVDGLEFCKLIKSNEITNHIPVILLTAKTSIDHRIEGLEVGADSYIPKPFNVQHLKVRISKLLELRKALRDKYRNNFQLLEKDESGLKEADLKFVKNVETIIDKYLMDESFSVELLGNEIGFSRMQLYRKLKSITDLSPNEFIRNYRLKKAAELLQKGEMNVSEVLYEIGFTNKSYFTKCFKEIYGMTPTEYMKRM
ncbi:hybrid sensor histidine kinase/response regulator [Puteibacter caeruleilacunae]|nr:hybrid sensor histidine kinase/response regulator [Puteibacter caeruleilacunae]